ncbi:putative efflux pump antibiotic resistance protein [Calycina marina]|uniref:Efflux pump antibiotic resistance protein n=1 Tax=Calycina marina TaxID=1763456 RepID=A0A9P7Z4T5_9HELO|nr:putative efflux pump antibiotic resistance protein [Calycina marina]
MEEPRPNDPTDANEKAASASPVVEKRDEELGDKENALAPQRPAEPEYPGPANVAVIMACILSAIFLMSLAGRLLYLSPCPGPNGNAAAAAAVAADRTIIATAIPRITHEFNSLDDVGWYGSAFMLTTSCFQLLWGRIYTFYSVKYVFLVVLAIFEVGSAISGAAPNSLSFIIGRAVAGVGSAGIITGAMMLMMPMVPLAKRPLYNGFFSAVLGTSSVVGPLIGGAFTSNVTWRWCFFINLPIGGVAMLTILWRIVLLFVLFGVCLVAFIVTQILRPETAIIQSSVITNRSVISAMWFMFSLSSTMLLITYYLPIWFQATKGKSHVTSGIDTLPLVISLTLASTLSGQLVGRFGYYTPFTMLSSCVLAVGAGLISTFKVDTSTGMWIGNQIILGSVIGLGLQHAPIAIQTVLQRKDIPMGIALVFFCQQLGGAIFVSVGQNVFNNKLIHGLATIANDVDPTTIIGAGATGFRTIVPTADLHKVLVVYNNALS